MQLSLNGIEIASEIECFPLEELNGYYISYEDIEISEKFSVVY